MGSNGRTEQELLTVFHKFDANCDGTIDKMELAQVLKRLHKSYWTDHKLDELFFIVDSNRDGKIQYEEFVRWLFDPGKEAKAFEHTLQERDLSGGDKGVEVEIIMRLPNS